MVYMIGSNLESEYNAASSDIIEMTSANYDPEHTHVLIYTGGAKSWGIPEISASENAIFEVANGYIKKIQTYNQELMTTAKPLTTFINYAYSNYPADLYDLILWDHGGGPIIGYGMDENDSDQTMGLNTLSGAIKNSDIIKNNQRIDFIGFDACLMGGIEVATKLKDYTDYVIASEESEPGGGWDYTFLSDTSTISDTAELGRSIIDHYADYYNNYIYDVDLSLSIIDTKKVDDLISSTNALFNKVSSAVTANTFSEYSRKMTRKKVYGYTGRDDESYDIVDLLDLVNSLSSQFPDEVSEIKNNISEAVIYNKSNISNTNGISVYFPTKNKAYASALTTRYKDVTFSDDYYNFLTKYVGFISGDKIVSRSIYNDLPRTVSENSISIELPDELVENYQEAELIIYRKLSENNFAPIYRSSEVELNNNILKASSQNLQFVVETTDKNNVQDHGWIVALEKERTDDYVDYVSYGVLYYNDDSFLGFSSKSYEMYMRINNGSDTAEVRDIRVASDSDFASKMSFDPNNIKFIEFVVPTYKLFDDNGNRLENIESRGTMYGTSVNIEDGDSYSIKLENLGYDFGSMYEGDLESSALSDYYCEFIVYDTQGNHHRLDLIHVEN